MDMQRVIEVVDASGNIDKHRGTKWEITTRPDGMLVVLGAGSPIAHYAPGQWRSVTCMVVTPTTASPSWKCRSRSSGSR